MIRRHIRKNKQVESILYSQHINELYADIDGTTPFNFYEFHQNPTKEIINKANVITLKMTGKKIIYVGDDRRVCVAPPATLFPQGLKNVYPCGSNYG
ncbi:hypothetical protein SAMN05444144_1263 [Flavobacterium akiainvivens]|nr:hypothetical protein SAMN05444144_1263 [Flavobacterium akiainvivens]